MASLALAGAAVFVGLSLGLLGGGGALLALPLFTMAAGLDAHSAATSSLVVVAGTSALGAALHARAGAVCWRSAFTFAAAGVVGAFVGGRLSGHASGALLLGGFAAVMALVAVRMWWGSSKSRSSSSSPGVAPARLALVAVGAGLLTGLVGAGGGFVVVPALTLYGGLSVRRAIGTSLVVIALQAMAGLAGKLAAGAHIAAGATALVAGGALVGTVAGVALSRRLPAHRLQKGFAALIAVMAVVMLNQAFRG